MNSGAAASRRQLVVPVASLRVEGERHDVIDSEGRRRRARVKLSVSSAQRILCRTRPSTFTPTTFMSPRPDPTPYALPLLSEAGGGRAFFVINPDPLHRSIGVGLTLPDDAFAAALADSGKLRFAVLEGRHEPHPLILQVELLEQRPPSS